MKKYAVMIREPLELNHTYFKGWLVFDRGLDYMDCYFVRDAALFSLDGAFVVCRCLAQFGVSAEPIWVCGCDE